MEVKKRTLFLILSAILFLPTGIVSAYGLGKYGSPIIFGNIVFNITTALWIIFTLVVVVCFVVAGIMFLTAMGDASKLKIAKSAFIWGIAGVVVGILAYSIITIIENFLFWGV